MQYNSKSESDNELRRPQIRRFKTSMANQKRLITDARTIVVDSARIPRADPPLGIVSANGERYNVKSQLSRHYSTPITSRPRGKNSSETDTRL